MGNGIVTFTVTGSHDRTMKWLQSMSKLNIPEIMKSCGQEGVQALSAATPVDTGRAAHSWGYEVEGSGGIYTITWTNSDLENGFPVVIMLQYGHGVPGGYVQGHDFINPAIRPIFDKIADRVWKAVTSA
jgi:Bacteriophage HK97-gp10, putative tail-component